MLENISWSHYIIAMGVLLVIWYLIIGCKFYNVELKQFISGQPKMKIERFNNVLNDLSSLGIDAEEVEGLPTLDTLEDTKYLTVLLLQAIKESVEKSFSKEELQKFIKLLLSGVPFVKDSALRDSINRLLVFETQKYPQFVLSHNEVDALWEETIQ
jgi:hypothetical protein